jgi:hypothetical protein
LNTGKTYLITGGAGFIGSHLAEQLLQQGHRVTVIDDLSTGSEKNLSKILGHPAFTFIVSRVSACPELEKLVAARMSFSICRSRGRKAHYREAALQHPPIIFWRPPAFWSSPANTRKPFSDLHFGGLRSKEPRAIASMKPMTCASATRI